MKSTETKRKEILKLATETLGNRDAAIEWMSSPCKPLGCNPIDLLGTDEGTQKVVDILGRIRHGVFS